MEWKHIGMFFVILLIIVAGLAIYFIPSFVAEKKQHKYLVAIFAINLFLGWTFAGWAVALMWALIKPEPPQVKVVSENKSSDADELMKYKALLDQGVITQQEFDEKKRQILGL